MKNYKRWSQEEDEFLMAHPKMSNEMAAVHLASIHPNITANAVRMRRIKLNMPKPTKYVSTANDEDDVYISYMDETGKAKIGRVMRFCIEHGDKQLVIPSGRVMSVEVKTG